MPPTSSDVVVVGAGIVGCAVAYELANRGAKVVVVDPDPPGTHQSGRNWGFVRQQGRHPLELPLMRAAHRRWVGLEEELDASLEWVQGGNLAIFEESQAAAYRDWAEIGVSHGVDTRVLTEQEIPSVLPGWVRAAGGALFASSDGQANPELVTQAYAEASQRAGARFRIGEQVRAITASSGRAIGVETSSGSVAAGTVVCAAGAGSRSLLANVGVDLPQTYVHGTVALTNPQPPLTTSTVWAQGLSFRQRPDGRIVCSGGGGGTIRISVDSALQSRRFLPAFRHNWRRFKLGVSPSVGAELRAVVRGGRPAAIPPGEASPDRDLVPRVLTALRNSIRGIGDLRAERIWAGVIDSTPDALPVIDRVDGMAGLVLATGFSGHGFGLAPAAATAAADLATGRMSPIDLRAMRLSRFTEGDFRPPDAIL